MPLARPSRRTSKLVAVPLAAASLLATAAGQLFTVEDHRAHLHKEAALVAAADVPSERLSDVACVDGFAGPFPCDGVDLLSFVPASEMFTDNTDVLTGGGLSDIWGWTDGVTGDEYVMVGKTNGTAFYRVTDPTNPVYLGEVPNNGVQLIWHDIKVANDYAFVVSESPGHGVQVFDLRKLRALGEAPVTPFALAFDTSYPVDGAAHNIVVNEETGYAYLVGSGAVLGVAGACTTVDGGVFDAGLHVVDIRNPLVPMYAGCYANDENAYVHDAQCAVYHGPDAEHHGKEICISSNEDFIEIVDVTDKSAMRRLGRLDYESTAYSHQGWMSEDQAFYFHGDELDEQDFGLNTRTIVADIRDLDAPSVHFVHDHGTTSIDHNMYTDRGLLFQSNYTTGLRVLDPTDVAERQLPTLAFFDTYPDDDEATFNGTWSNYPFFDSGTIAVSGIGEGLFLLRLQDHVVPGAGDTADGGDGDVLLPGNGNAYGKGGKKGKKRG